MFSCPCGEASRKTFLPFLREMSRKHKGKELTAVST
nr:MAG TPA: hypothetical protein [Caudoviricetes sp.]